MGAIYLLRHGQASFSGNDYDQLSDKGIAQSKVLGVTLQARLPQVGPVYSGTQRRHRDTARHVLEAMGVTRHAVELAGLNEYDHEDIIRRHTPRYADRTLMMTELFVSGDPRKAFQQLFKSAVSRWVEGKHDAEYAESWPAFKHRCVQALRDVSAELKGSENALVFTSGGPITAIAQDMLQIDDPQAIALSWRLVNCGITKLICGERGMRLSALNEHGHLEGQGSNLLSYR